MKRLIYTIAFGLGLMSGCVAPEQFRGVTLKEANESAILLTSVPPLLQDKSVSCGPTCVSAVAVYWEVSLSKILTNNVDSYYKQDFTLEELERLAVGFGLTAFKYQGTLADLEINLKKGRPVIVMIPRPKASSPFEFTMSEVPVSAALDNSAASHWVIVIGLLKDKVVVQDPASGRRTIPRGAFENLWGQRSRTALLLTKE